jgi:hypothetical protein
MFMFFLFYTERYVALDSEKGDLTNDASYPAACDRRYITLLHYFACR